MEHMYCTYCSTVINPETDVWRVVNGKPYYKCSNCGRVVTNPIILGLVAEKEDK